MANINFKNSVLAKKIVIYILICSSCLTLIATGGQLYNEYRYDVDLLKKRFDIITTSHLDSLAANLWDFQDPIVEQQLLGIVNLPDVNLARITTPQGKNYQVGDYFPGQVESKEIPIDYQGNTIGILYVEMNYQEIHQQLLQKTGVILITQFIKTLIIASIIIAIIHYLITRHLSRIASFSRALTMKNLDRPLILPGKIPQTDELDNLVMAINDMRQTLIEDNSRRREAELAVQRLNLELEDKVRQRTRQLEDSIEELHLTRENFIQAEKMAALGQLVAGVSHEINTPLGICITANSSLQDDAKKLATAFEDGTLSKSKLQSFLEKQNDSLGIVQRSLLRADELVASFKSVAVNQGHDTALPQQMKELFNDIISAVSTLFKHQDYRIKLSVPDELVLVTYAGAWHQILTNFLMNSHIHGFEGKQQGNINISLMADDQQITFQYQDDGCGIPESMLNKVFEPFVTSKRGKGSSGLGLNIVYNLVHSQLGGSVKVINQAQGCGFKIRIPQPDVPASQEPQDDQ